MSAAAPADAALRILVIDDEEAIRVTLSMCLEAEGHSVTAHGAIEDALEETARRVFDLIYLDLRLGVHNGLDFLPRLVTENPWAKVVVITAYASVATAVQAMKLGAVDYLPKPFTPAQVQLVTRKVAERRMLELKVAALQNALGSLDPDPDFPTESRPMRQMLEVARQVADSSATVLISGEIGTGKGRLARALHEWSRRSQAPFGTAACETTSAEQLDAELFGASLVRCDGATGETPGHIELCEGGTLVLDEVGQTPPSLQPKLLRLLSEKEFERRDDFRVRKSNVRVIATTSADLEQLVESRRFRAELLLALNVVQLGIPPLRQRPEDIRMLAKRYLAFFGRTNHRQITGFTQDALNALKTYPWPGNDRELRNLIERAVILCQADRIGLEHFPPNMLNTADSYRLGDLVPLDTIEDVHIKRVLESTGSIKGAAAALGIGVSTMVRWIKRTSTSVPSDGPLQDAAAAANSGAANEGPAR